MKWFFLVAITNLLFHGSPMAANFERLADSAGFIYDQSQDIYITKIDAFQRVLGYHKLFDFFAPLGGTVIDSEPIIFAYQGRHYMIELWKGQYFAATGAEIGIYYWNGIAWSAIKNDDMLFMRFTLRRAEEILFQLESRHWWLAGFFPGVFSFPHELTLQDIFIEFKTIEMRNAFLIRLYTMGYSDEADHIRVDFENPVIIFDYTHPKSRQTGSPLVKRRVQQQNIRLVNRFNDKKQKVNGTDNSPSTIDKLLRIIECPRALRSTPLEKFLRCKPHNKKISAP